MAPVSVLKIDRDTRKALFCDDLLTVLAARVAIVAWVFRACWLGTAVTRFLYILLKIKNLQDIEVFVVAADQGSLSAAARVLDLSPAVASASLKRLESDVGAVLLLRSTRCQRLTPEGSRFLPAARLLLSGLEAAIDEIAPGQGDLCEQLQISIPSDLGRNHLLGWLDEFQVRYPNIVLRIQISDRVADIFRQPVDLAIRYGTAFDPGLVAVPLLADNRRVLCASPDYLARHGKPTHPEALVEHNCLCFRLSDEVNNQWQFTRDGQVVTVPVSGNRVSDDGDAVRRWAIAGHGIAYKSRLDVCNALVSGQLVPLCPEWSTEPAPLSLVCADRRQLSSTVQLLRDHLRRRVE